MPFLFSQRATFPKKLLLSSHVEFPGVHFSFWKKSIEKSPFCTFWTHFCLRNSKAPLPHMTTPRMPLGFLVLLLFCFARIPAPQCGRFAKPAVSMQMARVHIGADSSQNLIRLASCACSSVLESVVVW